MKGLPEVGDRGLGRKWSRGAGPAQAARGAKLPHPEPPRAHPDPQDRSGSTSKVSTVQWGRGLASPTAAARPDQTPPSELKQTPSDTLVPLSMPRAA